MKHVGVTYHIGLMSGTSLDGVDGVILMRDRDNLSVTHAVHLDMPADLRSQLLALNTPDFNELHRAQCAANDLVRLYARAVQHLLRASGLNTSNIRAVGAHGQTVRHQPAASGARAHIDAPWTAYTLQLNNPALLAELTGIAVVADFRSRDVAAGGQGAPLVPAFHRAVFARHDTQVAVVNVGGMANVTLLPPNNVELTGFDTGPGNVLMDIWCQQHTGKPFDAQGSWAASGTVHEHLLHQMLADPYFQLTGPKSTGRELFNTNWLTTQLIAAQAIDVQPADVQATLCELTARTISNALPSDTHHLVVCGGGAFNDRLMQSLQTARPSCHVEPSDEWGLPAMDVEAAAFAWLAEQTVSRQPGNVVAVTGAAGPRILGAVYPA